jgi:hypothetical protein
MTQTLSLFAAPRPRLVLPFALTIPYPPRTKKTSNRIAKRGRFLKVLPSAAWMGWRDDVLAALPDVWRANYQLDIDVNIRAWFYRDADRGDACGFYQGVADVLAELRIVDDDVRLKSWDGSKLLIDRACPRTEVVLTAYSPAPIGA